MLTDSASDAGPGAKPTAAPGSGGRAVGAGPGRRTHGRQSPVLRTTWPPPLLPFFLLSSLLASSPQLSRPSTPSSFTRPHFQAQVSTRGSLWLLSSQSCEGGMVRRSRPQRSRGVRALGDSTASQSLSSVSPSSVSPQPFPTVCRGPRGQTLWKDSKTPVGNPLASGGTCDSRSPHTLQAHPPGHLPSVRETRKPPSRVKVKQVQSSW